MLKKIQQAEEHARKLAEAAHMEAETILKNARSEAAERILRAEKEARSLKESAIAASEEAAREEVKMIRKKADEEVAKQEKNYSARIARTAEWLAKKITEAL